MERGDTLIFPSKVVFFVFVLGFESSGFVTSQVS